MLQEVQSQLGLARPLYGAGIFETDHHRQILREVPAAAMTGRLAVISGLVGRGKTVLLRRIEDELARQKLVVAKSLAVDKERATCCRWVNAPSRMHWRLPARGCRRSRRHSASAPA